jgi:hypothetical protein
VAADQSAARRPMTCPDCAGPVWPQRERLCPRCGYPLMFLEPEPESEGFVVSRVPGERDDATSVLTSPLPGPPMDQPRIVFDQEPPAGQIVCPRCGQINPPSRIRCERCGQDLRPPQQAAPPPLLQQPPPARRGSGRRWLVVVGALAAVGLLAAAVALFVNRGSDGAAPTGQGSTAPVRVPPADITVSASSTLKDPPIFAVTNMLDGDLGTTWQSDGVRLGSNIGVKLTFRFARPARLVRITLINGDGRSPTDFSNNQRAARLAVNTGSGTKTWQVRDTVDPQTLDLDATPTNAVTLVVEAVYPGTRFKDLAVTDVSFDERP